MWGLSFDQGLDIVQTLGTVGAALAIIYAVRSYKVAQGHLNFDIIQNCMTRFQTILGDLETTQPKTGNHQGLVVSPADRAIAKRYIDLCSEELFYFQMKYVDGAIVDEWIDGMLSYLPLKDQNGRIVYPSYKLRPLMRADDLADYPRINDTFVVQRSPELDESQARTDYIRQIKSKVRNQKRKSPLARPL
jgi:hypothetical protein